MWLFQPFSSPPLTIQLIARHAPCPISTASLAQWLESSKSSNRYMDLTLWIYLPSHQMSSVLRMTDLFVFSHHIFNQVVPSCTALHKPSVSHRTPMLSPSLSLLAHFWSFFLPQPCPLPIIVQNILPRWYWWPFFNTEPLVVPKSPPQVRRIFFCFPTLLWTEYSPLDLYNGTFGLSVSLLTGY